MQRPAFLRALPSLPSISAATAAVTAVLAVDRPRDVAAGRLLFSGPALPRLDRTAVADPDVPLR